MNSARITQPSILVWRIGNIGDIVVAVPAFKALRRYFADQRLVLMTSTGKPHKRTRGERRVVT